MDFSGILSSIDVSTIIAALTAIAAIMILPNVAKWGYDKVIDWMAPDYYAGSQAEHFSTGLYDAFGNEAYGQENNGDATWTLYTSGGDFVSDYNPLETLQTYPNGSEKDSRKDLQPGELEDYMGSSEYKEMYQREADSGYIDPARENKTWVNPSLR